MIKYELQGMAEANKAFDKLDKKIKRKVTRKAVNAAVRPTIKAARKLAPKQTGLLRRSLTHKIKNYRKGAIFVAIAGQRVDGATKAFERAAIKAQSDKRRGGLSAKGKAVPIHLVESRVRPHTIKARPLENVMVPLELRGEGDVESEAKDLLKKVGLGERVDHYPVQLSGGEQQRVAIARAFINRPRILFADEPTGNLDSDTSHSIVDLLFELNRKSGTTLILVTHDGELASKTDRVLRSDNGKVMEES